MPYLMDLHRASLSWVERLYYLQTEGQVPHDGNVIDSRHPKKLSRQEDHFPTLSGGTVHAEGCLFTDM